MGENSLLNLHERSGNLNMSDNEFKIRLLHTLGECKTYSISFDRVNSPFPFTIESDLLCQAIQEASYFYRHRNNPEFWEELDNEGII